MTTVTPQGARQATEFTAAAAARLDDYLRQVRAAVAAGDLDPADVEADIREHVTAEFHSHTRPVALVELEKVLVALGPPAGWAPVAPPRPAPNLSPWALVAGVRRHLLGVVGTLLHGPEDWRLAYLCLFLTVLAVPTMGLLLPVAYLLARAAVALAAEGGEPLGARRWLVYPPVVLVSLPLLLAVTLWPLAVAPVTFHNVIDPAERFGQVVDGVRPDRTVALRPGAGGAPLRDRAGRVVNYSEHHILERAGLRWTGGEWKAGADDELLFAVTLRALDRTPMRSGVLLCLFVGLGAVLLWGLVLGLIGWQFPKTVAAVFFPLLSGEERGATRLAVGCGSGFVVWVGFACRLVDAGSRWV